MSDLQLSAEHKQYQMPAATCPNCHSEILAQQRFCSSCGQKARLHRLQWHDVSHDAVHYFTHADKGIFHLLIQLLTKTGNVAREFIQGKRKKYFPPFNFFLIVATIYVFVFTINSKPPSQVTAPSQPGLASLKDAKERENVGRMYKRAAKSRAFMSKHSNNVAMIALPFIAVIFWLWYRRAGYNYIEHLVANMYMCAFTLLVQVAIFYPVSLLMAGKNTNTSLLLFFVFQLVYFSCFYYQFINRKTAAGALKAFGVSLFAIACWVFLSVMTIRLYITNGLWGLLG